MLSAYALTGDLAAARTAVEHAFVAARHHWRKVRRLPRPGGVGPPACLGDGPAPPRRPPLAPREGDQRRAEGCPRRAAPPARPAAQGAAARPPGSAVDPPTSAASSARRRPGWRTGWPRRPSRSAARPVHRRTGSAPRSSRLAPIAEAAALPGPAVIQRAGQRRRVLHTVGGTAVLLALTLLGGLFVVRRGRRAGRRQGHRRWMHGRSPRRCC